MRRKSKAKDANRIREDLEKLGVAPEFSRSVSERLERFSGELPPGTYDAVLRYDEASRGLLLGFKHGDRTEGEQLPSQRQRDEKQCRMTQFLK